jgi:hypothetical protein
MFECINKLRRSNFWTTLEANAKPNAINQLFISNQMVKDITAAKNVFGHQASGGVCSKGDGGLCVCRTLIERLFDHAKDPAHATEQKLLQLVCANIPSGIALNFPLHAQTIADAVTAFLESNPNAMDAFEPKSDSEAPKALAQPKPPTKKCKTKAKAEEPPQFNFNPNFNPSFGPSFGPFTPPPFYSTATVHVTHTSYGPNHIQHVVANFSVGGVPMNDLFNQLNNLFAPR